MDIGSLIAIYVGIGALTFYILCREWSLFHTLQSEHFDDEIRKIKIDLHTMSQHIENLSKFMLTVENEMFSTNENIKKIYERLNK